MIEKYAIAAWSMEGIRMWIYMCGYNRWKIGRLKGGIKSDRAF